MRWLYMMMVIHIALAVTPTLLHTHQMNLSMWHQHRPLRSNGMESNVLRGYPVRLRGRGLSERTCSKFRIYKDGEQLRFHYCDGTGKSLRQK